MKIWALFTIGPYLLCMVLLAIPLLFLARRGHGNLFLAIQFYVGPVLLLVQAVLLFMPVSEALQPPVGKQEIAIIPSHIILRQRNECCTPPLTLIAIATGISIALLSFGPGALFL